MKGDFTRDTFDAKKHFSRVLRQQGRVELDADANEQTAILLHYIRTLAADILGPHAGPASSLGFELLTNGTANLQARLSAMEPDEARRNVLLKAINNGGDAIIAPGRYYVQGILVECDRPMLYTEQLGYPFNNETTIEALGEFRGSILVYLDVWERFVTSVEDDSIREVALGGPDTCARAQVVWQVKVLRDSQVPDERVFSCDAVKSLSSLGTGRLRARARRDKPSTDLCVIPSESRYRGAENQLYRVEIHKAGAGTADGSGATFKWSRDNGSAIFAITSLAGTTAVLGSLGRDRHSSLAPGDWVEVIDDSVVFGEAAGPLAQVETVDRDTFKVTLRTPAGAPALPSYSEADAVKKHALLRRWDHAGKPEFGGALPVVEQPDNDEGKKKDWLDLEDGVQIWFAKGGAYRVGDYWLIPARTATGDVEWPRETDADGAPVVDEDGNPLSKAREANGPRHYFAPLMLLPRARDESGSESESGARIPTDCRCRINSLPCYPYAFSGQAVGGDNL
ncbi:DUF6519 domain-containing protein [Sorangium sp. So ce131]|uniref:DUF6519 domain-containing protein n=1 Tax=Sorangium sp. So ce131 TaxID=3133282 RepID=UPI003F5D8FA5